MPLNSLKTLAEANAKPKPCPKGESRLTVKTAEVKDDAKKLAACRKAVWTRDEGKDRYTGRRVLKTIALDPDRGEAHHVAGRADKAVRYDPRNLILLSLDTHEKVERNELKIVGTKFFTVNGKQYIDCDHAVTFVKAPS